MIDDPILIHDWHPVARSQDALEGQVRGVRLLGEDLVLWRAGGRPLAWQDRCVHRGTRLSLGKVQEGDRLMCAYHGWTYDSSGQCVRIPAHPEQTPPVKARVRAYRAQERYDLVWVSLGEPTRDVPSFPEWKDTSFRNVLCGLYPFNASAPRTIENFLDIAHFPFVHGGILGDRDRPEIADYKVETGPDGVRARNVRVWQPDPYGTGVGDTVIYTYEVYRPLTAYLAKESTGPRFFILFTLTPHEQVKSTGWIWLRVQISPSPLTPKNALQNRANAPLSSGVAPCFPEVTRVYKIPCS